MDKQQAMARRAESLDSGIQVQTTEGPTFETAIAIQAARALASQEPRDLEAVTDRVLQEFRIGGSEMYYSWRQKDKHSKEDDGKTEISGIGVGGAMVLARNWGKCTVIPRLESENKNSWTISGNFIDFETGAVFSRLYQKQKGQVQGGYQKQRALDIDFSDAQSRALRNAILDGMPVWLKKKAFEAAREGAKKDFSKTPLKERLDHLVRLFEQKLQVPLMDLENHIDVPRSGWTEDHGVMLSDLYRAIDGGETTVEAVFGREPGQEG